MHWAWRTTLAIAASVVFLVPYWGFRVGHRISYTVYDLLGGVGPVDEAASLGWRWKGAGIVGQIPIVLAAFGAYGLLFLMFGVRQPDGQRRCEQCGYILRGLRDRRCPECGRRFSE